MAEDDVDGQGHHLLDFSRRHGGKLVALQIEGGQSGCWLELEAEKRRGKGQRKEGAEGKRASTAGGGAGAWGWPQAGVLVVVLFRRCGRLKAEAE